MNKKRGSAKLTVEVASPGELKLAKTKDVKGQHTRAEQSGKAKLTIKPRGKAKKTLNKRGKAKVKAKVTFTPEDGTSDTKSKNDQAGEAVAAAEAADLIAEAEAVRDGRPLRRP